MAAQPGEPKRSYPFNDVTEKGFKLNWMILRNGETGSILWQANKHLSLYEKDEHIARVPSEILNCKSVSRELNFSSHEVINNFHLKQRVFLRGQCVEEWNFDFGFVIPDSTNTWQTLMEAKPNIKSAEILSGHVVIVTTFYDNDEIIGTCRVRIFYV